MHKRFVHVPKETRRSRWVMECGFRLVRSYDTDHNIARFRRFVDLEHKRYRLSPEGKFGRMKTRRHRQQQARA